MGLSRLIRGELNKILMRPILYIIIGILVVALIFSATLYSPDKRTEDHITQYDDLETVGAIYTTFTNISNGKGKSAADTLKLNANYALITAEDNQDAAILAGLNSKILSLNNAFSGYKGEIQNNTNDTGLASNSEKAALADLQAALDAVSQTFSDLVTSAQPAILVKTADNEAFTQYVLAAERILDSVTASSHSSHSDACTRIEQEGYLTKMAQIVSGVKKAIISEDQLTTLWEYWALADLEMTATLATVEEIRTEADILRVPEMKELVKRYYLVAANLDKLIQSAITLYPVADMSDAEIQGYFSYEGTFGYALQEDISKRTFLVVNNAITTDYANVFSAGTASNYQASAFDFVHFGLEITGFIIIIFSVVLAAGMLAGEQSNGTLKLLMIRPYSRGKILTSKILATLIFALIFLVFSTIVLFLIGFFTLGLNLTPVLAVFNAGSAFVASPLVILLIYLVTLMLKITVFVLLGAAISTIFRSNVAAVGVSIVVYFIISLFGNLFSASMWYGWLPLSNIDLFKYFGGSFVSGCGNSPLLAMLSSGIFHGGNFYLSVVMIGLLAGLLGFASYWIFKKREIK